VVKQKTERERELHAAAAAVAVAAGAKGVVCGGRVKVPRRLLEKVADIVAVARRRRN